MPLMRPLDDLLSHRSAMSIQALFKALSKALWREPVAQIPLVEA
jgi:hypothetical protein